MYGRRLILEVSPGAVALLLAMTVLHCGKTGPPLPPEPRGPLAPREVGARQIGERVLIGFRVPDARNAGPAAQPILAELVRVDYPPGSTPPSDPDAFRRRGAMVESLAADPLPSGSRLTLEDRQLDALPGRGEGRVLRYAVRVRDRRGRPSPLVVAADLVTLPAVEAPTGLSAEPTADGMRLIWSPPSQRDDLRYNVYRYESEASIPETPLNSAPIDGPAYLDGAAVTGKRYRYVVRVALAAGRPFREGAPSAEYEVLAEDRFAPAAPRGLVVVQERRAARLFWDPNAEHDVAGYRVYRKLDDTEWVRIGPSVVERPLYLDLDLAPGMQPSYRVSAIDRVDPPNESDFSEPVSLDLRDETPEQR